MNYQVNYTIMYCFGRLAGKVYHRSKVFETMEKAQEFASWEDIQQSDELGLYHMEDVVVLDLTTFLAS